MLSIYPSVKNKYILWRCFVNFAFKLLSYLYILLLYLRIFLMVCIVNIWKRYGYLTLIQIWGKYMNVCQRYGFIIILCIYISGYVHYCTENNYIYTQMYKFKRTHSRIQWIDNDFENTNGKTEENLNTWKYNYCIELRILWQKEKLL